MAITVRVTSGLLRIFKMLTENSNLIIIEVNFLKKIKNTIKSSREDVQEALDTHKIKFGEEGKKNKYIIGYYEKELQDIDDILYEIENKIGY